MNPIVFMSNSSSCVMLHPSTNNPLQSKISKIAIKLKKHESDLRKSRSPSDNTNSYNNKNNSRKPRVSSRQLPAESSREALDKALHSQESLTLISGRMLQPPIAEVDGAFESQDVSNTGALTSFDKSSEVVPKSIK